MPEVALLKKDDKDGRSEKELEANNTRLDALGVSLSKTRSEAISYRQQTGIEDTWTDDEEYYEGIDEYSRSDNATWNQKPAGQAGLPTEDSDGSTIFVNITRPYVDTASARVGDMLLPTDDKPWAIEPTPIPDSIAIAKGEMPSRIKEQIDQQVAPDQQQQVTDQVIEKEKAVMQKAREQSKKGETRIDDWLVEANFNSELRKVIDDSAKIGTGVIKGPIPAITKQMAFVDGEMLIQETLQPVSMRVNPLNCFPAGNCGASIQNGSFHWERDDITERSLEDFIDNPNYIGEQVIKILKEGPFEAQATFNTSDSAGPNRLGLMQRDRKNLYEIWYFYGRLKKEDMQAAGCECDEDPMIDAHIVMVNNHVIRASRYHLKNGEFPYDYMPWQARVDLPWGIGVARQVRVPQRMVNGAGRNLMDNAGLAGGPMWIVNTGMVTPLDGNWEIAPRKGWQVAEDADSEIDVSRAFAFVKLDMMQADLQAIIELGMRFAEQVSGLPSLLQGQEQPHAETLGGQQMRRNDGSTVLRRIAKLFDDHITTPHIRRYYAYLLEHGDDEDKGDFVVKARGSSALVERDLQSQTIPQLANFVANPMFGWDPKKYGSELLKSQHLTPANFEYDDEEWRKIVENMAQPQPDSSVEVAQIREQGATQRKQADQQIETMKLQQKQQADATNAALKQAEVQFQMILEEAKQEGNKDLNLDKIKGEMTKTLMTLKTQVQLSRDGTAPEVATPVVEPEGRAPDGRAFQE